jgi:hypothetical protein
MTELELLKKASRGAVAYVLGLSPPQISRLKRQGLPTNADNRTFDLRAVFTWAAEREAATATSGAENAETLDALAEWRSWKCKRERLAYERESGELVELAAVEASWVQRVLEVKRGLEGLADRLPPLLVGKPRAKIEEALRLEIELLLLHFSRGSEHTPRAAEVDKLIAEIRRRGTSSHRAVTDAIRRQAGKPAWLRWDPDRGLYIDTRDGSAVPESEADEYTRKYPYLSFKAKDPAGDGLEGGTDASTRS